MFLEGAQCFAEVTHAGRLFQRRGAATPKARSPAVDNRAILLALGLGHEGRSFGLGLDLETVIFFHSYLLFV